MIGRNDEATNWIDQPTCRVDIIYINWNEFIVDVFLHIAEKSD